MASSTMGGGRGGGDEDVEEDPGRSRVGGQATALEAWSVCSLQRNIIDFSFAKVLTHSGDGNWCFIVVVFTTNFFCSKIYSLRCKI